MHVRFRRPLLQAGAAALAAAVVVAAVPTAAQTAPAPSAQARQTSEAETVAARIITRMLTALDLKTAFLSASADFQDMAKDVKSRPEWGDMLRDSLAEELEADMPALAALMAPGMAAGMSAAELREIDAFLQGPGGLALLQVMSDTAAGRSASTPSREATKALNRFMTTVAGKKFETKLNQFDRIMDPVKDDMLAELLPGTFRRFADKAEAGEAARRAAPH